MDMGMQHGQGHAALKGACSIGRGMQHGKGHAAWEGASNMDSIRFQAFLDKNNTIRIF
jgi:hypothetical protein